MVPLADSDGTTEILPRLKVEGTLNRLWTTDDRLVRNLVFDADFDRDRFESLNAAGEIEGGSLVALQIRRVSEEERRFDYRAESLGDSVRVFAGMDNITGGELVVKGWFDESRSPPVVIGTVTADRFSVYDAPALAHLFAAASLPGLANLLNDQGLVFDAAVLPFRHEDGRLSVTDGRLFGQGLRILLDGDIHTDRDQVDFSGTMVPTNPLNTMFENIPLLGDIITGTEEDGGIFAFTFNVEGPAEDPDVRVNPLSHPRTRHSAQALHRLARARVDPGDGSGLGHDERVTLAAGRDLDRAIIEVGTGDLPEFVGNDGIVEACAASPE